MKCHQCDSEASHSTSRVFNDGLSKTWYYCNKHEDPMKR